MTGDDRTATAISRLSRISFRGGVPSCRRRSDPGRRG